MKLIGLLLLLGLVSLVEGKVVDSFATCPDFFIQVPPTVLVGAQYKLICQLYKNKYRYATLYDTSKKIPVYSAYKHTGYSKTKRKNWMIEPQLDDINNPEMTKMNTKKALNEDCEKSDYDHNTCDKDQEESTYTLTNATPQTNDHNTWWYNRIFRWFNQLDVTGGPGVMTTTSGTNLLLGTNQALNRDYEYSGYDKGHLYPCCNNCDQEQQESTFTLTNAAPQRNKDNIQWYHQVEKLQQNITTLCSKNTAYVVTGVIPGNNVIMGGVNIPIRFWSAYCCRDVNNNNQYISQGYKLEMTGDGKSKATYPTVVQLNTDLTAIYNTFKVFGTIPGCS